MHVLVLQGGISAEREVSLRSAATVIEALKHLKHSVTIYDPIEGLDGLDQFAGQVVDVVFPVLHGLQGEDGVIQAKLEELNLPFIGADSKVSRRCFDKDSFRQAAERIGVRIPHGHIVAQAEFNSSTLRQKPFVLKPLDGGSSIDTYICKDPADLKFSPQEVFSRHEHMLLEELIAGIEITVPVLINQALPVIEIIPPAGEDFDYTNKYNGKTQELCPPQHVTATQQKAAQELALSIHQQLGVRHLSRTDMIINKQGELIVLELNTIPGLTATSLFPKAAAVAGLTMPQLVEALIQAA